MKLRYKQDKPRTNIHTYIGRRKLACNRIFDRRVRSFGREVREGGLPLFLKNTFLSG
jgi:hypothetical protein